MTGNERQGNKYVEMKKREENYIRGNRRRKEEENKNGKGEHRYRDKEEDMEKKTNNYEK